MMLRTPYESRTDGDLQAAFLDRREDGASKAVVRRHERLALNVCARVLGDVEWFWDGRIAALPISSNCVPGKEPNRINMKDTYS